MTTLHENYEVSTTHMPPLHAKESQKQAKDCETSLDAATESCEEKKVDSRTLTGTPSDSCSGWPDAQNHNDLSEDKLHGGLMIDYPTTIIECEIGLAKRVGELLHNIDDSKPTFIDWIFSILIYGSLAIRTFG